jgi:hypothetical protein
MTRGHHVGLEQSPLQVHMVITQGLVHSSQDLETRGCLQRVWDSTAYCSMFPSRGGWPWDREGSGQPHSLRPVLGSVKEP